MGKGAAPFTLAARELQLGAKMQRTFKVLHPMIQLGELLGEVFIQYLRANLGYQWLLEVSITLVYVHILRF